MINFSGIASESLIGRVIRAPLRLIPRDMVVPILQGPMRGMKWIAGSSNHGCWFGSYELAMQRAFRSEIGPGDTVYDIGANVGFYTLFASVCVGPQGRVYSFEPLPRNIADLRRHIVINHLTNCEVIEAAVSRSDGMAQFDASRPRSMGQLSTAGDKTVPTVSLDSLVSSKATLPPNVVKIDVEGAETYVLEGATEMLSAHRPVVFLATHGSEAHDHCVRVLCGLGYELSSVNSLPVENSDELVAIARR